MPVGLTPLRSPRCSPAPARTRSCAAGTLWASGSLRGPGTRKICSQWLEILHNGYVRGSGLVRYCPDKRAPLSVWSILDLPLSGTGPVRSVAVMSRPSLGLIQLAVNCPSLHIQRTQPKRAHTFSPPSVPPPLDFLREVVSRAPASPRWLQHLVENTVLRSPQRGAGTYLVRCDRGRSGGGGQTSKLQKAQGNTTPPPSPHRLTDTLQGWAFLRPGGGGSSAE
eukprot:gene7753-biopygen21074